MKHRIRVYRARGIRRWYVACLCGWTGPETAIDTFFGRLTWDEAFAAGIAHQQNSNGRGECG